MNLKAVALLLTLGFTCAVFANTLDQLGMRDAFGSEDQVVTLKKLASDHPDDEFIAIIWSISMTDKSVVESLLFYERTSKKLWRAKSVRVGSDRLKPQWVGWTDVTDEKIHTLKSSEGFELPGFHTGEGSVPLSDAAASFLKKALSKKKARN